MTAPNTQELALVITGRDNGGSATARDVGQSITTTAKQVAEANRSMLATAEGSAAALRGLGTAARVQAGGGIVVLAAELEKAQALVRAFGSSAQVMAGDVTDAGAKAEAAAAKQARALALVEIAAHKQNDALDAANNTVTRIDPKARSAANGLTAMAFALANGGNSAQSLALAGGLAASSLASLSSNARIAASANGIGALVTAAAALYGWYEKLSAEQGKLSKGFSQRLGYLDTNNRDGSVNDAGFQQVRDRINAEKARATHELEQIEKDEADNKLGFSEDVFNDRREAAYRAIMNANAESEALQDKLADARHRAAQKRTDDAEAAAAKLTEKATRDAEARERKADQARERAQQRRDADAQKAKSLGQQLGEETQRITDEQAGNSYARAVAAADRQHAQRLREIASLRIDAAERVRLVTAANAAEAAAVDFARREEARRDAEVAARKGATVQSITDRANAAAGEAGANTPSADPAAGSKFQADRLKAYVDYYAEKRRLAATGLADTEAGLQAEEALQREYAARITQINAAEDAARTRVTTSGERIRGAVVRDGVDQLVRAHKLSIKELVRAGLEPKIVDLEGDAIAHFTKSAAAFFALQPAKGAGEALAGAKSLAGAAALSALGGSYGGSSGGGGGGAGASGGYAPTTFTPRESGDAGGNVTLIVQTVDPTSPGVISNTIYELNRAGYLSKPAPGAKPATTGITHAFATSGGATVQIR